jgi:hypothetical protein
MVAIGITRRHAMKKLATLVITLWLTGTASAQLISSDPNFIREGPAAYNCKTPLGKQVVCNKWSIPNTGWKRLKVTPRQTVFGRVPNPEAHGVTIERPASGQMVFFSGLWADHRDLSVLPPVDFDRANAELIKRKLKGVQFQQNVEIKELGNYRLSSCMAAKFPADHYDLLGIVDGGFQVTLEQFMGGRPEGPEVHMVLPKKATWHYGDGDGDDIEILSTDMTIVETDADLPESAPAGEVHVVKEMHAAWVYEPGPDGSEWVFLGTPFMFDAPPDAYEGHAGLNSAYHIPLWWFDTHDMPATWTCHTAEKMLDPGFYVIRANVLPTWYQDAGFEFSDNRGFGAIKSLGLEKVGSGIAAN